VNRYFFCSRHQLRSSLSVTKDSGLPFARTGMSYQYNSPNPSYASVTAGIASGDRNALVTQSTYPVERYEPNSVSTLDEVSFKGTDAGAPSSQAGAKAFETAPSAYYYYGGQSTYQPPPPVYQPAGAVPYPNTATGPNPQAVRYEYLHQGEPTQSPPQNNRSDLSRGICAACVRGIGWGIGIGLGESCAFALCNLC
jgi:hypothetical protein